MGGGDNEIRRAERRSALAGGTDIAFDVAQALLPVPKDDAFRA